MLVHILFALVFLSALTAQENYDCPADPEMADFCWSLKSDNCGNGDPFYEPYVKYCHDTCDFLLNCLFYTISTVLRKNVEKKALIDAMDTCILIIDEICDEGQRAVQMVFAEVGAAGTALTFPNSSFAWIVARFSKSEIFIICEVSNRCFSLTLLR
ncbi:hypothetical protein GCK32_007904 [Trichostrongylus colubriformis]|uniref:ShKT domain-containing protein n=1 Tax=Trichostrongylus colubriformis TaxID=6319 RepID=A0AAN8GEX7_TRICO